MKLTDLMDMRLGDLLDNYVVLYNLECDYPYGIAPVEVADEMEEKYDVDSYRIALSVEPLMDLDIFHCDEVIDMEKIGTICNNLGIKRKDEQV